MQQFLLLSGLIISCFGCTPNANNSQEIVQDSVAKIITIPVAIMGEGEEETPNISLPRNDELPIGPESFVVLPGPEFGITDPLNKRIMWFDSIGVYIDAQLLSFIPRKLQYRSGETFVEDGISGQYYKIDDEGIFDPEPLSVEEITRSRGVEPTVSFSNEERTRVSLDWPGRGVDGAVEVAIPASMQPVISVRGRALENDNEMLVMVESGRGGDEISVGTHANVYNMVGDIQHAWRAQQLDSYITLSTTYQVQDNRLYQLVVTAESIQILIYN